MTIPRNPPPASAAAVAIVQYSNGLSRSRPAESTSPFASFVGFYSEVGKDADFDAACAATGATHIEVRHGTGSIVRHWWLGETLRLFPLTSGPVALTVGGSLRNGNAARSAQAGIGVNWQGEGSRCAVRGVLAPHARAGHLVLCQLSVSGKMSDRLLAALADHARVAQLADQMVDRVKHPEEVGLWELLLPLVPGEEETWHGRNGSQSVSPLRSDHLAEIERGYIVSLWRPAALAGWAATAWAGVVEWASSYQVSDEGTPVALPAAAPAPAAPEAPEEPGLFEEPAPERVAVIKAPPKAVGTGRARH